MEKISVDEVINRITEIEEKLRELDDILMKDRTNDEGDCAIENFYCNLKGMICMPW